MKEKSNDPTESKVIKGQVVESIKAPADRLSDEKGPRIKFGKVDSLSIHQVSESELVTIESGSSNSIYLNFSIFLLSIATSFLIALMTTDYKDKELTFIIFTLLTIVGFLVGTFLLFFWFQKKDDFKEVLIRIRERMD